MVKVNKSESSAPFIGGGSSHNVLATGTTLKGEIHAEQDFRVDGNVEGTIYCKGKVVIGPQSNISGNIECTNLEVMGHISGNIECSDTLILRSSAVMLGDISVQVLEIEPGAKFDGSSSMVNNRRSLTTTSEYND